MYVILQSEDLRICELTQGESFCVLNSSTSVTTESFMGPKTVVTGKGWEILAYIHQVLERNKEGKKATEKTVFSNYSRWLSV